MDGSPENDQQVQDAPEREASDRPSPPAEEGEDLREEIAEQAEERDVREVAEDAAGEDELPAREEPAPDPGAGGEPEEHDIQASEQAQEASVTGVEGATEQQRSAVMEEMAEQHAEEQDQDAAPAAEEAATQEVEEPDEPVAEQPVHAEPPTEPPTEAEKTDEEEELAVRPGEPATPPEEAAAPPEEEEAPAHAADQEAREPEEQPPAEEAHAPAGVVDEPEAPVAEAEPPPEPEPEEAAAVPDDPFSGPGDWYVIHTYSGYENKVKANLGTRIQSMQMQDKIFDVVIPLEDVMEVKGGKKQVVQKKVFPGYLLVRMDYDDDSWYVVRNTPGVTGFVSSGTGQKPTPLPRHEVEKFLAPKEEEAKPQFRLEFEEGDVVRIIAGPFADFNGTISEINVDQSKVKVMVNIFDRETPVELSFDQVARV